MKRFQKTVGIEDRKEGIAITLDKRALKTPPGHTSLLPYNKRLVATLVATEWENQRIVLKPHALPMTSLASRAIDNFADSESRKNVRPLLIQYLDTDTICFYQDYPPHLIRQQETHWDPLFAWVEEKKLVKFTSILSNSQSEESPKKLSLVIDDPNQWEMAASDAAGVEVNSHIERWGEVEDTHVHVESRNMMPELIWERTVPPFHTSTISADSWIALL
ncbi:hypothetical protein GG344DRAFT_71080 [Lentinula edodes]|nr:hypothetical protein GG344DRAFT_71080 [Lentinula edodes]